MRGRALVVGIVLAVLAGCGLSGLAGSTADAADWLAAQQDAAGWFPWTPATSPPTNTQGPSGMGMLNAYLHTKTSGYMLSATDSGGYMLDPMWVSISIYGDDDPRFATHDPLFMEYLSLNTGDPQYADFMQANFWDKLTAGTYGASDNLDAAGFGAAVVNGRAGQGIVELSPWDLSATAIAAHLAGEYAIRDAFMGAILDGLEATASAGGYDVTGLAGAVWASAVTGIDLDPTTGVYVGADSTADLAVLLSAMTTTASDGAWLWSSTADPSDASNGDVQNTAFAIAALDALDRATYIGQIARGVAFIRSLQQPDGQFLCWPGAPLNGTGSVEVNAEAISAIVYVAPPTVYVDGDFAALGLGADPGGPGVAVGYDAFGTIQGGVDEVGIGGAVQVEPDSYDENVVIQRPLTLEGAAGWPSIDPAAGAAIMLRSPGGVPLVGVVIDGIDSYSGSYGILLDEDMFAYLGEDLDVRDLTITGWSWYYNHTNEGIAILNGTYVSNMLLDNVWMSYNNVGLGISGAGTEVDGLTMLYGMLSDNSNHGLLILSGPTVSDLLLSGTAIVGNSNEGVHVQSATLSGARIDGCLVVDNNGMGLWFQDATVSDLAILGTLIQGNAQSGVALHSGVYDGVLIAGSTFSDNGWEHLDLGLWGGSPTLDDIQILGNVFDSGAEWAAIYIDGGTSFGPDDVGIHYNVFTLGDWAIGNSSGNTVDASLNWWGNGAGPSAGAPVWGSVIYSPWLGINPDGDDDAVGVQLVSPLLFVVDDVGPAPGVATIDVPASLGFPFSGTIVLPAGYLNRAIGASNLLVGHDTIEVRHGTYDASEPITDGVTIVSETGSTANTFINGPVDIRAGDILLGRMRQGFTFYGPISVAAGYDASTIHINWNNIYGVVTNGGFNTLDATYNFWGTDGPNTVGAVAVAPILPLTAETIIGYIDGGLTVARAIEVGSLIAEGLSGFDISAAMELEAAFGFSLGEAAAILAEYGYAFVSQALARCGGDYGTFLALLVGYGVPAGGGAALIGGGAGGAVGPSGLSAFVVGDTLPLVITLVDPITGEVMDGAFVTYTVGRQLEGGSYEIVAVGAMSFDGDLGAFTFNLDTTGFEPGVYDIYLGSDDGRQHYLQIEILGE